MQNKRGQGLSTSAIILIVLGVVVLGVLVIGFTMGWEKIAPWLDDDSNIDTIRTQCALACSTASVYDFCSSPKTLDNDETRTCYLLATEKKPDGSTELKYANYNIETCPGIPTCP